MVVSDLAIMASALAPVVKLDRVTKEVLITPKEVKFPKEPLSNKLPPANKVRSKAFPPKLLIAPRVISAVLAVPALSVRSVFKVIAPVKIIS